jgi:hypothetical protein
MSQKMDSVEQKFIKLEEKIDFRIEKIRDENEMKQSKFEHEVLKNVMLTVERITRNEIRNEGVEKQVRESVDSFKSMDINRDVDRLKTQKYMSKIMPGMDELGREEETEQPEEIDEQAQSLDDFSEAPKKQQGKFQRQMQKPIQPPQKIAAQSQTFECPYCHRKDFWSERALQIHMNNCDLKKNLV